MSPKLSMPHFLCLLTEILIVPVNRTVFDRGTQELKILTSVIVDKLKWLMHVENYWSRNWTTWPVWQFNLCTPGCLQTMEMVPEPLCSKDRMSVRQIKNWSTDEQVLGKWMRDCNSYIINLFFSLPTLSSPYKRSAWAELLRWFLRVCNPHHLIRSLATE